MPAIRFISAIGKGAAALALAMLLASPAFAQSYPSGRIRIIVPFGAGARPISTPA